jgi:hypothetical protein
VVAWALLPDRAVDLPMELDLSEDELANVAEHADDTAAAAPPIAAADPAPTAGS